MSLFYVEKKICKFVFSMKACNNSIKINLHTKIINKSTSYVLVTKCFCLWKFDELRLVKDLSYFLNAYIPLISKNAGQGAKRSFIRKRVVLLQDIS